MIAGIFHQGSGLGDQLFRYITVRTLAEEKGYEWGMCNPQWFKGNDFMPIDTGLHIPSSDIFWHPDFSEKRVVENSVDIRGYDPEINFVQDKTLIDGSFEDAKYWHHNLATVASWLAVEPVSIPDDLCIVGFRGGEYATQPDLFLPPSYWLEAMETIGHVMKIYHFQVHTDDPVTAQAVLSEATQDKLAGMSVVKIIDNQPISHSKHTNMGRNWRSARHAKYAIIPNSAFFIIPRLLKHLEDPTAVTIAPRYWARRNTKVWARPACYYKPFTYI